MKGINQLINRAESLRIEVAAQELKHRNQAHWNQALADIVALATKMRSDLDRITGYMALPIDTTPEELALAVKLMVRRVQDLEQGPSDLERRVTALEAQMKPMVP